MKINKKKIVTIGIPALNEENNIQHLLLDILKQKEEGFIVEKIIVLSDGSTDKTSQLVSSIKHKKIKLLSYTNRGGKPKRINELFSQTNSDILVILDADIKLKNNFVLRNLIKPFVNDSNVMVTSGEALPLYQDSFIEKIFFAGAMLWRDTISKIPSPNIYQCEGEIRAFNKLIYKKMRLPMKSAEDVYPYLYCVKNKHTFKKAMDAVVYYKLPTNFYDYVHQMSRFLGSENTHQKRFSKKITNQEYSATTIEKIKVVLKNFLGNPFYISLYIILLCIPRLNILINNPVDHAKWRIITSSKKLNPVNL